jgi:hypothetical protein
VSEKLCLDVDERKTVVLSKCNAARVNSMCQHLRVTWSFAELADVNEARGDTPAPFSWDRSAEASQKAEYREWFNRAVPLSDRFSWAKAEVIVEQGVPVLPFKVRGKSDALIVLSASNASGFLLDGIAVNFELKKPRHDWQSEAAQAKAQHIVYSLASDLPMVTVLSDLRDQWVFLWTGAARKLFYGTAPSRGHALAWLRCLVGTDSHLGLPSALAARAKLEFVPVSPPSESDVANLADLEGCMESEADRYELKIMRCTQLARRIMENSPSLGGVFE